MVKINFLDENKKINVIDAKDGSSLLEVAKKNNVNLEGTCGGEMLCSTCHVYILSEHIDNLNKQTIKCHPIFFCHIIHFIQIFGKNF